MPTPPLRKDAARTRESILAAAEELLAADALASFAEISIAAEVSTATVYRHFPDRASLLIALMERSQSEIEAETAELEVGPDSFDALLTLVSTHQARYQGVLSAVRRGEVGKAELAELEGRTLDLFRAPFAAAKEAGRLRADLGIDDVIPLLGMIDGALSAVTDRRERDRAASRALRVVLDGVHGAG
jgi:AcrR family transcriptional regulator